MKTIIVINLRPCERRLLPKFSFSRVSVIGVFRKLGLERVIRAFSELVPTRENSFRLVPTLIFAKNRVFSRFSFSRVSVIAVLRKLGLERVIRAFSELVSTRENSFRLETRLESSEKSSECRALDKMSLGKGVRKVAYFPILIKIN